jgi:Domain of unknown function (DUF4292)
MKKLFPVFLLIMFSMGCEKYKRSYTTPKPSEIILKVGSGKTTSYRANGRTDTITKKGRVKLKSFLIADKFGRIRFEALTPPPLNSTVLLVTSDGSTFRAHDKKYNKFFQGKSNGCAIERILRISLSPKELYGILLGEFLIKKGKTSLKWDSKTGSEVVTVKNKNYTYTAYISGRNGKKGWKITKSIISSKKGKVKIEYRGYKKVGKYFVPERIRIRSKGQDVIFTWKKIEINPDVEVEAFGQSPPPNIEIQRIICDGEKSQ